MHAALYLVVALSRSAGVYLLLGAEFVAWVQILIYVGAIVILFLFGLMLTKAPIGRDALDNQQPWLGADRGARRVRRPGVPDPGRVPRAGRRAFRDGVGPRPATIGEALFRDFVLPFEAVSFLLLAALIGAIVLARKDDGMIVGCRSCCSSRRCCSRRASTACWRGGTRSWSCMAIELMLNAVNVNLVAFAPVLAGR